MAQFTPLVLMCEQLDHQASAIHRAFMGTHGVHSSTLDQDIARGFKHLDEAIETVRRLLVVAAVDNGERVGVTANE
jgi:hypothetical protein